MWSLRGKLQLLDHLLSPSTAEAFLEDLGDTEERPHRPTIEDYMESDTPVDWRSGRTPRAPGENL